MNLSVTRVATGRSLALARRHDQEPELRQRPERRVTVESDFLPAVFPEDRENARRLLVRTGKVFGSGIVQSSTKAAI